MNYFRYILQDYENNRSNTKGRIISICFRIASFSKKNIYIKIVTFPFLVFYKFFFEWIIGFEVPYNVKIGEGFQVLHLQAIVINKKTIIGNNCKIRHSLTIGNNGKSDLCPIIGNNVNIGANVCIIGGITIGNNVNIGAGSVVVKSFPDDAILVGNPAKNIAK